MPDRQLDHARFVFTRGEGEDRVVGKEKEFKGSFRVK